MLRCRIRCGIRPGHIRGNRAVVDDTSAPWSLALHYSYRLLRAQECAGQVDIHHSRPLFEGEILHWNGGSAGAGVVEEKVQAAECISNFAEKRSNRLRFAD